MKKIVVTQPMYFSPEHKARLGRLGDVTYYDDMPASPDEWLARCQDFDIICSNIFGIRDRWEALHGVFVSVPFVGVGFFDPAKLKANNVVVSSSPGCNRHAVAEWIVGMLIMMARQLDKFVNLTTLLEGSSAPTLGLASKNVTILGKGNIGSRVGAICQALEMNVTYFRRGDDLHAQVEDADVIIDTLSTNSDTKNLLDAEFFSWCKDGALFISIAVDTVNITDLISALDSGELAYAALDAVNIQTYYTGDPNYQKLAAHPKAYVTPHVAFNTDVTRRIANDMMINNVEAYLSGKPIHVVGES